MVVLILVVLEIATTPNFKFQALGSRALCDGGGGLSVVHSWVSNAVP